MGESRAEAIIEIETSRLRLRPFTPQDANVMCDVLGDAEVMRYSNGVMTLEQIRTWIAACDVWLGPWAVVERDTERVIGYCGLFRFADVNGAPEIEIGYRLARASWGKGYATEAATAVRDYAFEVLRLRRLIALIDPANAASIRVAQKIGMHYEAEVMLDGYTHPDHVYVIEHR